MSPGFADVLALWDAHHLNHAQKVCTPLLCLLADMLSHTPVDAAAAQGFVHLQLDGLAHSVMQRRMRAVYSHLTSGIRVRHNCALALVASIASRSRQLAWEVFRNFDFTLAALPKLANPPRNGAGYQGGAGARAGVASTWADADPLALPTRHVFVRFVLALLESGDQSLLRPVLAQKVLLGNVLHFMAADPAPLASRVLRVLRDAVLAPGGGVPARLQAALCGDAALEQMAGISVVAAEAEVGEEFAVEDDAVAAAELAHGLLLRLCTEPSHGLCPLSAMGRWRGWAGVNDGASDGEGMMTYGDDEGEGGDEGSRGGVLAAAAGEISTKSGGGKRGAAVVRLLRKLKPTESRRHAELLLTVCTTRPLLAAAYLPHATYSLDPRPSVPWLAAAMLLGKVAAAAAEDPTPPPPPPDAGAGEVEGLAFVRAVLPPSLNKAGLTKGLQHNAGLVRHATLCLLLQVLRALRARIARLDEAAAVARRGEGASGVGAGDDAGGGEGRSAAFTALAEQARRAAILVLPDPQVLLAVLAARRTSAPAAAAAAAGALSPPPAARASNKRKKGATGKEEEGTVDAEMQRQTPAATRCGGTGGDGEGGSGGAKGGDAALVLTRIHALNALSAYAELLGADGLAEAKVDPARLLPAAPLALPPPELAATISLLSAVHGVRRHGGGSAASSALAASASAVAAAVGEAAAAAAAAVAMGMGAEASRGPGVMPQGHVLGVLLVAAGASAAGVRRDAAVLAATHLATCGALENPAVARREAGAWLAHLPRAPSAAAEAACAFLAEAVGAAARRRGLDANAAAVALHAHETPAFGWPRSGERSGGADDSNGDEEEGGAGDPVAATAAPVIPAGATGEDLDFSGLAASAIAASVKVTLQIKP
jgi:nucleolar pre-ribosomal-associated protein 1